MALHQKGAEELLRNLALPDNDRADVLDEALRGAPNGETHARTMRPPVSGRRLGAMRARRE